MTSAIEVSPVTPVARTFRLSQAVERCVVPVLLIAGWEVFARSGYLPPALLPAPSARAARAGRLGLRLRRDDADLFRSLDARRFGQRAAGFRRLRSGECIGHPGRCRHRLVPCLREDPRTHAADVATHSTGLLDTARHHLVRHRQQAGDLPGFSRRVLSRPDEYHPWRENGRSQPRTGRSHDGSYRAPAADRHRVSRGTAFHFLRPAYRDWFCLDVDRHGRDGRGQERSWLRIVGFLLLSSLRSRPCGHDIDRLARYLSDLGLKAIMARVLHWQTATTVQGRAG